MALICQSQACSTSGRGNRTPALQGSKDVQTLALGQQPRCQWTRMCSGQLTRRQVRASLVARSYDETSMSEPYSDYDEYERVADPVYIQEYEQQKAMLLDVTRKSGGIIAGYLLFTYDGEGALLALLGSAASYFYMQLLFKEVDSYTGKTIVGMAQAKQIENGLVRNVAKVIAAYRQALRPRLLVPIGLAAGASAFNAAFPDLALDLGHKACLLAGFLAYKGALVTKVVDELTPKSVNDGRFSRPVVERMEDDLDQWGRPKKAFITSPTDVIPEDQRDVRKVPLAALLLAADETAVSPTPDPKPQAAQGREDSTRQQ